MMRGADRYDDRAAITDVRHNDSTTASSTAIVSSAKGARLVINNGMLAPTAKARPELMPASTATRARGISSIPYSVSS